MVDTSAKLHVDSSFPLSGEQALNPSSNRPLLSRISTHAEHDNSDHAEPAGSSFRCIGMASQTLNSESSAFLSDEDLFNSASAPERTTAFPQEQGSAQHIFGGPVASSPAQAFLSMFSPPSAPVPLPETVVAGYRLIQTIGRGGFSTVKKGISSSGEVVAIKRVRRVDVERQDDPDECRRQLENEIEIWRTLNHEHILPLFDVERTIDADYFITLYCPAGSLFDILKRDGHPALAQDDAGMLFRQVVRGLRYLHETAKVVHGDIKLENVLVDEAGMCRITDFGLARKFSVSTWHDPEADCPCLHEQAVDHAIDRLRRFTTISHTSRPSHVGRFQRQARHRNSTPLGSGHDTPRTLPQPRYNPGSLPYAAPELLSLPQAQCPLHPPQLSANPAQDLWALGVLLYTLLTGHLPFSDSFEPRLQMKIMRGVYDPPSGIGHGAESVLCGCLEPKVSERWTINMVDEVAWGVGWGEAGDVSTKSPSHGSLKTSRSKSNNGRSRSQSRIRPYAEHVRPHPDHFYGSALLMYGSDGSVFSSSVSRSRSRPARNVPEDSLQSPSLKTSFSSSTDNSVLSEDHLDSHERSSVPPPLVESRGSHATAFAEVNRVRSLSSSNSHSTPESPATPSDIGSEVSGALHDVHVNRSHAENHMPTVLEKDEEVPRGRRRTRDNDFERG